MIGRFCGVGNPPGLQQIVRAIHSGPGLRCGSGQSYQIRKVRPTTFAHGRCRQQPQVLAGLARQDRSAVIYSLEADPGVAETKYVALPKLVRDDPLAFNKSAARTSPVGERGSLLVNDNLAVQHGNVGILEASVAPHIPAQEERLALTQREDAPAVAAGKDAELEWHDDVL